MPKFLKNTKKTMENSLNKAYGYGGYDYPPFYITDKTITEITVSKIL